MPKWITGPFILLSFAALALIAFWHPSAYLMLSHWLSWVAWGLIFAALLPAGKCRFGAITQGYWRWLAKVWGSQAVVCVLFLGFITAILGAGPPYVSGRLPTVEALAHLGEHYAHWGLFPWSMVLLWAVYLAYFHWVKAAGPYIYHATAPIIPKPFHPMVKAAADGCMRGVNIVTVSLTAAVCILLVVYWIERYIAINHSLVPSVTGFLLTCFTPILFLPFIQKRLRKAFARGMSLAKYYTIIICVLLPIMLVAGVANNWTIQTYTHEISQLEPAMITQMLVNAPERFAALFLGWWCVITPLWGSYLANISKGRSLRQLVTAFLLFPLFIYGFSRWMGMSFWLHVVHMVTTLTPEVSLLGNAIFHWVVLMILCKGVGNDSLFLRGFLGNDIKASRLSLYTGSKSQGIGRFHLPLFYGVLGVLMLHSIGGWLTLQIQLSAISALALIISFEIALLLLWYIFSDKVWLNNRNIAKIGA